MYSYKHFFKLSSNQNLKKYLVYSVLRWWREEDRRFMKIDHGVKFAAFRDGMIELVELFSTGRRHLSLRCSPFLVTSLPFSSLCINNTKMIHEIG